MQYLPGRDRQEAVLWFDNTIPYDRFRNAARLSEPVENPCGAANPIAFRRTFAEQEQSAVAD